MNFKNLLKPLLQAALDAALPTVKTELKALIGAAVMRSPLLPADTKAVVVGVVGVAIDGWTIRL